MDKDLSDDEIIAKLVFSRLSPPARIADLEAVAKADPENLLTKFELIGAYFGRSEFNSKRLNLLEPLIERFSSRKFMFTPFFHFQKIDPTSSDRLITLWKSEVEKKSNDVNVLMNAAYAARTAGVHEWSNQLYQQSLSIDPDNQLVNQYKNIFQHNRLGVPQL